MNESSISTLHTIPSTALTDTSVLNKVPLWHWIGLGLCVWFAIFFISINWQIPSAMGFVAYTKDIAAILGAYLFYSAQRGSKNSNLLVGVFSGIVTIALLWGINDTFYWDGIQTAGRAHMLYEGNLEGMRRMSLTYVIIGFLLRYVANTNWMGHLYMAGCAALLLYIMSLSFRHKGMRMLTVLMGLATPYVFVLSKWLYLDMPVMTGIAASLFVFNWAARKPGFSRFMVALPVLAATCMLKEVGALVFVPLLALPLFVPKSHRLRVLVYVTACILISAVVTYFTCSFHAQTHSDKEEANWLLFNPHFGSAGVTFQWFANTMLESLRSMAWWGFLFLALMGIVRPRTKFGYIFLAGVFSCQIVALLSIRNFEMSRAWAYAPLMESSREELLHGLLVLVPVILACGLASRCLSWRRPRRIEWLCWIFIAVVLFFFAAAGKIYTRKDGVLWISTDWRYIEVCVPLLVMLAAGSIGRLLGEGIRNGSVLWLPAHWR